jgi:Asp-tRNA(Asn)/Glu-tRNA(Gln) amidotransferase A subunit family amidase
MLDEDLCYLSATQAVKLFKAKSLSPVELLQALIARAENVNPHVNCFAEGYLDEAMSRAKQAEQNYTLGRRTKPLEGIPLAVKDSQRVRGKRTTHGSLIFKNAAPDDHSDPMIERLENAGANIFARTTTPEFCLSGVCHSRIWGTTYNPWNLAYGPGGSSGGSGAALAAGLTILATGTDHTGSIRIPAAACGVIGFKPPHGRNPDGPPANFEPYNHCGPMTRSVADAALMQNITSGPHPLDKDSLRSRIKLPVEANPISGLRIAYSLDLGFAEVEPEVCKNMLAVLAIFKSLGATITEVDLGWTQDVLVDCGHWTNMMHFGRQTIWHQKTNAHLMTDYALKFAEHAKGSSTIEDVHKPFERAHVMYQTLGPVLEKFDLFMCPTNNAPAVLADHDPWDQSYTVNGKSVDPESGWVMTFPFNMLHNLPVLAVPSGHASTGVPTGIQLVGKSFDERQIFQAALAYEQECGGWFTKSTNRPKLNNKA